MTSLLYKKVFYRISLAVLFFFALVVSAEALQIPKKPRNYITDNAGLLRQNARIQLENALRQFEQKTSTQVVVATFPSLENEALEDFSMRLAEAWKIGQKEKDNGVILLIFKKEQKIRLEIGYGLEGALTDAESSRIIHEAITPFFKQNQFNQGIAAGVAGIMQAVEGEYQTKAGNFNRSRRPQQRQLSAAEIAALKKKSQVIGTFILLMAGGLFIFDFFRYGTYASTHKENGQRYSFWEWFFRFALLLAVLSFIFRMLFYMMLFSRGGYGGSRGGGGGGFSSGGGSFGGGGASGGW